jgi:hypothetical protein
LKEYAFALRLNQDEVLEAFKGIKKAPEPKQTPTTPPAAPPPPPPPPKYTNFYDEEEPQPEKPRADYQLKLRSMLEKFMANPDKNIFKRIIAVKKSYIGIGLIVLILAIILYAIFSGKTSSKEINSENRPVSDVIGAAQDTTKNGFGTGTELDKKLPEDADTVILVINTKDTTKIRAIIDKKDTLKPILDPSQPTTLNASKRLDIKVDNASLLSLILNDKPLELPKKKGTQTFSIDKNGLISKTIKNNDKSTKGKTKKTNK